MKRLSLLPAVASAVLLVGVMQAASSAHPNPLAAKERACSLPNAYPLWIDFQPPFWEVFAKPGLVTAAANFIYPPKIRALGGSTVYFDLNFHKRLGSPSKPIDEASVVTSAHKLYFYSAASMNCTHPWIALNELFGASLPPPWSPTNVQYRANVLEFIKILAGYGAQPFLLVNSKPYTGDEAGDWWREVARYADIVREVYFPATTIYSQGPAAGSRTLRHDFRQGILDFTSIGIPVSKLGIFLGFQTEHGQGGREGLKPAWKWFDTIKWQVLAIRQVQRELKFATIWSWGWGEWGGESIDPDKPAAACVYLWARNPRYCNGPAVAGARFDTSRSEGQIDLPSGIQCLVGGTRLRTSEIAGLTRVTHDKDAAFSTAFARIVESRYSRVSSGDVRAAEQAIVSSRFGGSFPAYRAALAQAGAGTGIARRAIADELRRALITTRLRVGAPSSAQTLAYYQSYGSLKVRSVAARQRVSWLGGRRQGIAISSVAPAQVFRAPVGRWTTIQTALGRYRIRPLGPSGPLTSVPFAQAQPSITAALVQAARSDAFERWTAARQSAALRNTVCRHDARPAVGGVDLTSFLPFLSL